jgi:hypothetical protein
MILVQSNGVHDSKSGVLHLFEICNHKEWTVEKVLRNEKSHF